MTECSTRNVYRQQEQLCFVRVRLILSPKIKTDLNCLHHFTKWLMTVIQYRQSCVSVCAFKSRCSAGCRVFGSLLWFPCTGMCEDLAGRAPRHLLNIRGNNSWADLKHGHPLHLTVSLRITPAASHSRWQVPVHQAAEYRARQWVKHRLLQTIQEKNLTSYSPTFSCCAWEQSGWYTVISPPWYPTMFDFP